MLPDPTTSASAVDALGFDEDGDPALLGHDPVVLVEVVVRSGGGGEDLADEEPLSFAVDPLERIVGPGELDGLGNQMSLKNFRKDIIIELYNEAGQLLLAYRVYRCWVSEYQGLPDLDANGSTLGIESIRLENEGWERDVEVKEPVEASF